MENNNHLLETVELINNLQKNATNSTSSNDCEEKNTIQTYNTRPISFYLCNNSPLRISYTDGESIIFRIERIKGSCVTVRILAKNEDNSLSSTNEFATININCISAIQCFNDIWLTI